MKVRYERELNDCYAVLPAPEGSALEYHMMETLESPLFILPEERYGTEGKMLYYRVGSGRSLQEIWRESGSAEHALRVMLPAVMRASETLCRHLLTEENLLLEPELIFPDEEGAGCRFLVYPAAETSPAETWNRLFSKALLYADTEHASEICLLVRLLQETASPSFSVQRLAELLPGDTKDRDREREDGYLSKNSPYMEPALYAKSEIEDFAFASHNGGSMEIPDKMGRTEPDKTAGLEPAKRQQGLPGAKRAEKGRKKEHGVLYRLVSAQLIMLAGLLLVYLLKGRYAVIRTLPLYLLLCLLITLWFLIDAVLERRKRIAEKRTA